jgi:hypothetical protein
LFRTDRGEMTKLIIGYLSFVNAFKNDLQTFSIMPTILSKFSYIDKAEFRKRSTRKLEDVNAPLYIRNDQGEHACVAYILCTVNMRIMHSVKLL